MFGKKTANSRRVAYLAIMMSVALMALSPATALADAKPFGVIDSARIANEYPAARDAQEQYEQFIEDLEKEVADKERELQRLIEEIESQKMLLGEAALAAKTAEFENQRADYFQFREGADKRAEDEYTAKIGPIVNQVKTITERIGKEEGFGLVIDATGLTILYVDSSVDLTDKVLAALVRGED